MADVAAPAPAKSPKKKAAAKPKKPSAHPKYSEMIGKAIAALKERGGSSRQAILKYIMANFNVGKDAKSVNAHLKLALRAGVKNNSLKQSKGTGASGSFRIGEAKQAKRNQQRQRKQLNLRPPSLRRRRAHLRKKRQQRNQLERKKQPSLKLRNQQQRKQPSQRRQPSHQLKRRQPNQKPRRHQRRNVAAPAPAPAKSPKKKAAAKPKKPSAHPKYSEMIGKAIAALKERGGSSRQAILKYIMANFNVGKDAKSVNAHLKLALRAGVKNNSLKQSKGTGASGSFRIGEAKQAKKKPAKAKKAAKPKAAKPKKAKSTPKKKKAAKKPAGEKGSQA
ncbi:H1_5 [Mytilus coruscus]|uniref:H1_5 n=1 Tax=Mytilus coruscus TaxID=42192 RepID=A0A6J8ERP0_MYTCO|nr:H1_5 [Mytilus coruscus]